MSKTAQLGLPLLQGSQAQKHITVNEAMTRLDGLAQLRLVSRSVATPPSTVVDGDCYGIPAGAGDVWGNQNGNIAIGTNGGWVFATPAEGWRAWIMDEQFGFVHQNGDWQKEALSNSPNGAGVRMVADEFDHVLTAGTTNVLSQRIPQNVILFAASARVISDLTGTLTSWSFGEGGQSGKFGTGLGLPTGSYCNGMLSQPTTYYAAADLEIEPVGGDFTAGTLRVALHYMTMDLPGV